MIDEQQGETSPLGALSAQPAAARRAINEMIDAGLLDHVMSKVDAGGWR